MKNIGRIKQKKKETEKINGNNIFLILIFKQIKKDYVTYQ